MNKLYYIIGYVVAYVTSYLLFRYGVVLLLPFIIAYVFAWMIKPVVKFLNVSLRINNKIASAGAIIVISLSVLYGIIYLSKQLLRQCISFMEAFNNGRFGVEKGVKNICGCIEAFAEAGDGIIGRTVWKYMGDIDFNHIVKSLVGSSLCQVVSVGKVAFVIIVAMFASYYFLTDRDSIDDRMSKSALGNEIRRIKCRIYSMGVGYIKAQAILFVIVAVICYGSYCIAGTGYPLLLAVVSAALDALPMIGVSVILVPLIAFYVVKYEFISVLVLMICLIICYCIREVMEPRIMGKKAGLSPLCGMITIYAGYKLFGISGVITGPFAYIVADEIKKILFETWKVRMKCHRS